MPTSSHTAGNLWSVQSILKTLKQSTTWDESTVERVYEADVFPAVSIPVCRPFRRQQSIVSPLSPDNWKRRTLQVHRLIIVCALKLGCEVNVQICHTILMFGRARNVIALTNLVCARHHRGFAWLQLVRSLFSNPGLRPHNAAHDQVRELALPQASKRS